MEGTSDARSRSSFAGRQTKRSSGKAGNGPVPGRSRWSLSGRLPRYRGIATGGVRTPWVGVKARLRAIASVLVGGVDAGPCPIQSPTGSLRKDAGHPEATVLARGSSDEGGRPSAP